MTNRYRYDILLSLIFCKIELLIHLVRSASFPGAKIRRLETFTATTPVVPVTPTTRATGLPATMISCTPKL